jgi:hypothetical protein
VNGGLAEATAFGKTSAASRRQKGVVPGPTAAKPSESSRIVRLSLVSVVRDARRKARVDEEHLSNEVVPDRGTAALSRATSRAI